MSKKNHCQVCDDNCEAPAGIGIRGGYKNMPKKVIPFCSECGQPVCTKCSVEAAGKRICNDCSPETLTGYSKIIKSIEEAPATWTGGIMLAAVQACVRKKFFKDRAALLKVVENALKEQETDDDQG